MIVVFADDLSGAAEIAGIVWRTGLDTRIQTDLDYRNDTDVLIIDNNTRSLSTQKAIDHISKIAQRLSKIRYDWLYIKTDSVLRGNIAVELQALMSALDKRRVILVPANPSAGKIIKNNLYYIDGQLLHNTDYKNDPEYPIRSSNVLDLLKPLVKMDIHSVSTNDQIDGKGLFIGETKNGADIKGWASQVDNSLLPAGGSDFFKAILDLEKRGETKNKIVNLKTTEKCRLYVVGSASKKSKINLEKIKKRHIPVCLLPCVLRDKSSLTKDCLSLWINDICSKFTKNKEVVCAIDQPVSGAAGVPKKLNEYIATMIGETIRKVAIDEIMIEGGGTASHCVRYLGWQHFKPLFAFSTGTTILTVEQKPEYKLIVKPGRYPWPKELLTA